MTPISVLAGLPGRLFQNRDSKQEGRVELPGLQAGEGVCKQEADDLPVSPCAGGSS